MEVWIVLAVVITTAIFVFYNLKIRENEIKETQVLLLQFIDQFEQQYQILEERIEKQRLSNKEELIKLYDRLEQIKSSVAIEPIRQKRDEKSFHSKTEEHATNVLKINERYSSVVGLYKDGNSIEEIARKTGKGIGEIQLIFELLVQEDPNESS